MRSGRPRGFDRDAALKEAMHLFWQHGYEGASLDQLRRAMGGLSSASFYAAFGSKEALFRESLARYLADHGGVVAALRDADFTPRERLERALLSSVAVQTDRTHPLGCMVTLSATMGSAAAAPVQALTTAYRQETRQAITDCIEAGVASGDLARTADIEALTCLYDALLLGISIQARDGVAMAKIVQAVQRSMHCWDAAA